MDKVELREAFSMATRNGGFFVQSNHGGKGNFEVVIPRIGGGVSYYWRDNDGPTHTWYDPFLAFATLSLSPP